MRLVFAGHECRSYDNGMVLWTAGHLEKTTKKYVWTEKRQVKDRQVYINHYMRYTNWIHNHWYGDCIALLSGDNYSWAKTRCSARYCFVCETTITWTVVTPRAETIIVNSQCLQNMTCNNWLVVIMLRKIFVVLVINRRNKTVVISTHLINKTGTTVRHGREAVWDPESLITCWVQVHAAIKYQYHLSMLRRG